MKLETKIVWIAAFIQLVNVMDFMMVMPLGPDICKDLPVTNDDIGYICGCYTVAVGVSGLICATFLDKFDRKKVALVTVLGLSIGTVCAAFAWDMFSLIAARVVAGIFGGPAAAIAFSIVCDVVPAKRRGKAIAIVMGAFSLSSIFALPLSLEIAQIGTWRTPFYLIATLGLLVFFAILFSTPSMTGHINKGGEKTTFTSFVSNKLYILAFIMMMSAMVSSYSIIPNISAYFQLNMGFPRGSLSMLYAIGGVFSLILIQIGGRASDKMGPIPANILGTLILVFYLYDGFMHPPYSSLLMIFTMFTGMVCFRNVAATTEASKLPAPHERAAFMSVLSSLQHLGNGIGAFGASALLSTGPNGELVNMKWVGLLSILTALVQPVVLIVIRRINAKRADEFNTAPASS